MNRAEAEHACEVLRRWPLSVIRWARRLPPAELVVLGELAGFLDAEPWDDEAGELVAAVEGRARRFAPRPPHDPPRSARSGPTPEWLELGARLGAVKREESEAQR